jgi:hypothetical protein
MKNVSLKVYCWHLVKNWEVNSEIVTYSQNEVCKSFGINLIPTSAAPLAYLEFLVFE